MVLGIIITIGVAIVIVFIIIKLIRSSNITGHVGNTKQCIACGRKTNSLSILQKRFKFPKIVPNYLGLESTH